MPAVNPKILTWARETAGLSMEAAAKAIKLSAVRGSAAVTRLAALERGEVEPTQIQLARMAKEYRRPLITFYLEEPPPRGDRGEDFRKASGASLLDVDPQLDALIRNVRARHDLVKSLLEDEEMEPLTFVGSCQMADGADEVAQKIKTTICFDLPTFREKKNFGDAFGYLRECLERQNIFVLLLGNLGSYHSNISSQAFRGYAISDSIAPFIVINDNDTRAAWSFTAFHEAAHLWLGQTGISGSSHERIIERFCNDVAGRLLLPISDLEELPSFGLSAFDDVLANISEFASARKISRRMVAYQLLRANLINSTLYKRLGDRFYSDWQRSKERSPNKTKDGRGPHPYVLLRHRLGPAIVGLAKRSLDGGQLSPTKASHLLGVKPVSVHSFLHPQPGVRADR